MAVNATVRPERAPSARNLTLAEGMGFRRSALELRAGNSIFVQKRLRIKLDDLSRPSVIGLLSEHLRNMHQLSPPDQVFAFDVSKLKAPDVSFWTAWNGELLFGCAALKELSSTQGEIKSMGTPSARRKMGAGRALPDHIINVARSRGYEILYLETGRHPAFLPAQTLYGSVGFKRCGPFGTYMENGNSVFMSLSLSKQAF